MASPDGKVTATMQADGNFVLTRSGSVLWHTGTGGQPGATLRVQPDGNLVVYKNGSPLWDSQTGSFGAATLTLQNDGNLVMLLADGRPTWSRTTGVTGNRSSRLGKGYGMKAGQYLKSPDGNYQALMQPDGNFVVYRADGTVIWHTSTGGQAGASLLFQNDNNLVVYKGSTAVWHAATTGLPGSYVTMQNDGNLVMYPTSGAATWSSKTGVIGAGGSKVDSFAAQYKGKCVDYDGAYGAQCVDLYNFYNRDIVGAQRYPVSYAYQLWTNYDTGKYSKISAGSTPQKGDVAIWNSNLGGGAGHVAIVLGNVDASTINVLDQNWPTGSCTTTGNRPKANLLGYLRPIKL